MVDALITSWLHYCNALLSGCTQLTLKSQLLRYIQEPRKVHRSFQPWHSPGSSPMP
uniref:Uncharacterized protein n=1 Tax=Anguilla anguilla TaxID=7936 RepID=A0A0E9SJ46_ANGAN